MRILIYGENYSFALAPQLKRALEQLNYEANIFDYTSCYYTAKGANLKNRILNKLMLSRISRKINKAFQNVVINNTYDCILIITGWHLTSETIDIAKKHGNCVVNWSMEELFNNAFAHLINTESYLKYDCVFSPRPHLFDFYLAKGIKHIEYLPFFYYPEHRPVVTSKEDQELWGSDIAFMGTWSKDRENVLRNLEGHNVKIWGGYWDRAGKNFKKKFTITNKIAWLGEMSKVANSTKIIVDILTKAQKDKINMKNYQIPACGGFLLTERTDEILELFEEDKEIACYGSTEELKSKCDFFLVHETPRNEISANAHKKVTNGGNSLRDRAKQILDVVKTL